MIWRVFWKTGDGVSCCGFVKVPTRAGAIKIARKNLQKHCVICGCVEAYAFQITPQSITLNFQNTSDYDPAWDHSEIGIAEAK